MTGSDALAEQLIRLLDVRLTDPLEILLDGDDSVAVVRGRLRRRALDWAFAIEHGSSSEAVHTLARLMATLYPDDHAFAPPVEWWRTPLGQAVARRVGHPFAASVSYAMAGAMLGITRQGVHDLVRRGKLPRHPEGGVPVSAVRERLLATGPLGAIPEESSVLDRPFPEEQPFPDGRPSPHGQPFLHGQPSPDGRPLPHGQPSPDGQASPHEQPSPHGQPFPDGQTSGGADFAWPAEDIRAVGNFGHESQTGNDEEQQ